MMLPEQNAGAPMRAAVRQRMPGQELFLTDATRPWIDWLGTVRFSPTSVVTPGAQSFAKMLVNGFLAPNTTRMVSRPSDKAFSNDNERTRDAMILEICATSGTASVPCVRTFGRTAIDASVVILRPCSNSDMVTNMLSAIHDTKIGQGVICDVVVDVMDNFVGEEKPSQAEHSLIPVFKDITAFSSPRVLMPNEPNVISLTGQDEFHENSVSVSTIRVNK